MIGGTERGRKGRVAVALGVLASTLLSSCAVFDYMVGSRHTERELCTYPMEFFDAEWGDQGVRVDSRPNLDDWIGGVGYCHYSGSDSFTAMVSIDNLAPGVGARGDEVIQVGTDLVWLRSRGFFPTFTTTIDGWDGQLRVKPDRPPDSPPLADLLTDQQVRDAAALLVDLTRDLNGP